MGFSHRSLRIVAGLSTALLAACVTTVDPGPTPETDPGSTVDPKLPAEKQAELDKLMGEIEASANMTRPSCPSCTACLSPSRSVRAQRRRVPPARAELGLAADADELDKLGKSGFVISDKQAFSHLRLRLCVDLRRGPAGIHLGGLHPLRRPPLVRRHVAGHRAGGADLRASDASRQHAQQAV